MSLALGPARQVHAASMINVTTTADEDGTGTGCSLREAFTSADDNANFGGCTGSGGGVPFTINVPAGTYTLTLDELRIGDATNTNTSIVGAGAASTIIQQTLPNRRVINVNFLLAANVSVSISGVTITGGRDPSDNFGGAGIIAGGAGNTLSLSNCTITGNSNNAGLRQGGGVEFAGGGTLNINNCTISNNTAGTAASNLGMGGGVDYRLINLAGAAGQGGLSITNSTFSNNAAGAANSGAGGAVYVAATTTQAPSGLTITNNTFTGNQANAASNGLGGAITNASSHPVTIRFNRFFNNSATGGATGIYKVIGSGSSTNAADNWWGCNAGPGNAGCDSIGGETANTTVAPRLALSHTSSANALLPGEATVLTASFLKDSAGGPVAASNLGALIGMPVSFTNPQNGSLSNAQTTIQANGTATATFMANAPGVGQADAIVDNGTATASIMINRLPTTVTSINRNTSSATNAGSISWIIVFADPLSSLSASNVTLTNSGLGGDPAITGVTPVGDAPATMWVVTASTGSGDGTLGLNLANDTNLDYALSNLPFTGQAYTIDRTAPTVTINQATGQADPTDSAPINFIIVFDEPVTGFTDAGVTLSGTAHATTVLVTGSGTTYNVAVNGITRTGTVVASIPANAANDEAGNGNIASTSSDNAVTVSSIPKRYVYLPLIEAP
jgi:CSLREA domain-containing protein